MAKKNLTQPPSGHGRVETDMGRTGGPRFGAYAEVPGGTSGPRDFALPAAVAGHNDPQQSIPHRRPTQDQMRDNPGQYSAPRRDYTAVASNIPPERQAEHATGRPDGRNVTGPPSLPANDPGTVTGLQLGHDGRVPYAGRDVMMVRTSGPPVTGSYPAIPTDQGGLEQGHDGPRAQSGNAPGAFEALGDQTPSAAREGERTRAALRALAASRGGTPADLERPTARGRRGGLMTSYESHQAGAEAVGINPPGAVMGGGMETHEGPADGSGPERC